MRFLLADSFTGALARLPAAEAKAVKTTVVDLQIDPAGKGLSFHRIDKSQRPEFLVGAGQPRSAADRAQDGRQPARRLCRSPRQSLCLGRTAADRGASLRPAQSRSSKCANGSRKSAAGAPSVGPAVAAAAPAEAAVRLPFAALDDAALLSVGVPADWLGDVRAATERQLLRHGPAPAGRGRGSAAALRNRRHVADIDPAARRRSLCPSRRTAPHPADRRRGGTATGARISVGALERLSASLAAGGRRAALRGTRPGSRLGRNREDRGRAASGCRARPQEPAGAAVADDVLGAVGPFARRQAGRCSRPRPAASRRGSRSRIGTASRTSCSS